MGVICLTEDMKVRRNGVIDFVTNVQVGDIVDYTKVTEVLHKHMREGYYVVNGELKITNDHPVLANGSWKRTEDLMLGDYINDVKVASIEYIEKVTPTVYIGTEADRYTVYTEGATYTVHGQYKNALKKAA
jgi:intein/homing endonuclease